MILSDAFKVNVLNFPEDPSTLLSVPPSTDCSVYIQARNNTLEPLCVTTNPTANPAIEK